MQKCLNRVIEIIVRSHMRMNPLGMSDMDRFLAAFIFSQCSGFSVSKNISLLTKLDCPVLALEFVRFLSAKILAFSATGRDNQGEVVWNSQREQTVRLTEF